MIIMALEPGDGQVKQARHAQFAAERRRGEWFACSHHRELGEFILPYEAVRTAPWPDAAIIAFIDSTYGAAATLGRWDRVALERPWMKPGPPPVSEEEPAR